MFGLFGSDKPAFLTETRLHGAIHRLVEEAKDTLTIISPYVEPGDTFVRELERKAREFAEKSDRDAEAGEVSLVFRADKLPEYRKAEWFRRLDAAGVFLGTIERLHSKIYANEHDVLITSVNFTHGSWASSYDVGILVPVGTSMNGDIDAYLSKLGDDCVEVNGAGGASARRPARKMRRHAAPRPSTAPARAHCVGCGKAHAYDPQKPMHYACWQEKTEPRFCHGCGQAARVTARAPLCDACYRARLSR